MKKTIFFAAFSAVLCLYSAKLLGQCATGQPAKDRYCNDQYLNFTATPGIGERYYWPTISAYTNNYISPTKYPYINTGNYIADSTAMLVDVPYIKEITPATTAPVRPSDATITGSTSSMSNTAFDLDITSTSNYKLNYMTLCFQSFYINPGRTYTFTISVAPGPVTADAVSFTSEEIIAGRIGASNYYMIRVPIKSAGTVGMSLTGGVAQTINFNYTVAGGGSDIQYSWFDATSAFLPNTSTLTAGGNTFTANYGTSTQNISGTKKPGIFDLDVTFVCPTQYARAEFEFNTAKCCYGNKKPVSPNLVNNTGYTFINNGGLRTIIFDAPYSKTLTASLISDTSYFKWYKDGVELVAAGGTGQEILSGINTDGYYAVKAATVVDFINDINCVVYDTVWVQSRILNATKTQDTICFGKSLPVSVVGATGNIQWTPANLFSNATSANPTFFPTNIQTYTVKVNADISIGDKVTNGSFTSGALAPASIAGAYYTQNTDLSQAGRYLVMNSGTALTNSPEISKCADHTSGSGNYLAVNSSGSTDATNLKYVWSETFAVTPNTPYEFSAWLANINNNVANPAGAVQYYINYGSGDVALFASNQTVSGAACAWQQLKQSWNSGSYSGNVTIKIASASSNIYNGADFGVDDITFGVPSKQEDTLVIKTSNCLKLTTSSVCLGGDRIKLIADVEGGTFGEWTNTSSTHNSTIYNPTLDTTTVKVVNGELSYTASAFVQLSNVISNSTFSDGVSGFNSDYSLVNNNLMPGQYTVSSNPGSLNTYYAPITDHTSGSGNMLVVDRSTPAADRMWYQTSINVQAGLTYDFSLWFAHLNIGYSKGTPALEAGKVLCCNCANGTGPTAVNNVNIDTCNSPRAYMEIVIDGQTQTFTAPFDNLWHEFRSTYTAATTKNISISFKNHNIGGGGGMDFAIDDVTFAPRSNISITQTVPINCPLPVSFIDFFAKRDNGSVQLNWITANEVNVSHFIVERSLDGIVFTPIKTVPFTAGNHVYTAFDEDLNRTVFYRIKEVDASGLSFYSKIILLDVSSGFILYPNPAHTEIAVIIQASESLIPLEIKNVNGCTIFKGEIYSGVEQHLSLNLKPGMYLVEITQDGIIQRQKLIVE